LHSRSSRFGNGYPRFEACYPKVAQIIEQCRSPIGSYPLILFDFAILFLKRLAVSTI
jgi:hypothetical protein